MTQVSIRSKRKTVSSFVANYIHYLDPIICQYVIEQFKKNGDEIFTIHDCFNVKPQNKEKLQLIYKARLVLALLTTKYHYLQWFIRNVY
jgi:hypothetical protein